ncbi:MAG TPA: alpha/beta fold hydrolase [Candidatus Binatia bacterium]
MRAGATLLVCAILGAGCSTILAVNEQSEKLDANATIGGTVSTAGYEATGPLIVGVVAAGTQGLHLVDYFVAEKPGAWMIHLAPGTYWVAAFEDRDRNGRYNDEPGLPVNDKHPITVAAGERRTDIDVAIPRDGRLRINDFSMADLHARGADQQQTISLYALSVAGRVVPLDDPRFDQKVASSGMWKPYDFLIRTEPGIYFLEPYDPARIPVLFVHGIGGTPADFRALVGALDHRRFQAWVAYYPSGARLDGLGEWLSQLFVRLRTSLRFDKAVVVAHSMGGLVARSFVLDDFERSGTKCVRTFVTISSPLGGMESAGKGVENSPVVIRSWHGLAPKSEFLDGLFYKDVPTNRVRRTLPAHMAYHMIFGYHGGDSSDGVVALSSQLRLEAQQEARSIRGYDETHTGILESPAVANRLAEILGQIQ